jgi:hypothetical protein
MEPLTFFTNACMFTGLFFGSVAGWLMILEARDAKFRLQALCRAADTGRRIVFDEQGMPIGYADAFDPAEIRYAREKARLAGGSR